MDTDSLCLTLSEQNLYDGIRHWVGLLRFCEVEIVPTTFQPNQQQILFLEYAVLSLWSTINENLVSSKKNSATQKWFLCAAK